MLIPAVFFFWGIVIFFFGFYQLMVYQYEAGGRIWPGLMGCVLGIVYIVMCILSVPPEPTCTKTEVQKVLDCQDKGNGHMTCRDATEEVCVAYSKDGQ
jgi:hypothetical protein